MGCTVSHRTVMSPEVSWQSFEAQVQQPPDAKATKQLQPGRIASIIDWPLAEILG
jgi:hypothetical protein